jgi:hypothetical protein
MRYRTLIGLAGLLTSGTGVAAEYLEKIESPVMEVPGVSSHDLAVRARLCVSQQVTNRAVVLRDESRSAPMAPVVTQGQGDTTAVAGGDVLRTVDLDAGLIIAQSRITIGSLMPAVIESTITVEARDGRFKITQTGIQRAFVNSGIAPTAGFKPVFDQWGAGADKVKKALEEQSAKIGDCVASPTNADW